MHYDKLFILEQKKKEIAIYRRSITISKNFEKGEKLATQNTKLICPDYGLESVHHDHVIGREAKIDVPKVTALTWKKI